MLSSGSAISSSAEGSIARHAAASRRESGALMMSSRAISAHSLASSGRLREAEERSRSVQPSRNLWPVASPPNSCQSVSHRAARSSPSSASLAPPFFLASAADDPSPSPSAAEPGRPPRFCPPRLEASAAAALPPAALPVAAGGAPEAPAAPLLTPEGPATEPPVALAAAAAAAAAAPPRGRPAPFAAAVGGALPEAAAAAAAAAESIGATPSAPPALAPPAAATTAEAIACAGGGPHGPQRVGSGCGPSMTRRAPHVHAIGCAEMSAVPFFSQMCTSRGHSPRITSPFCTSCSLRLRSAVTSNSSPKSSVYSTRSVGALPPSLSSAGGFGGLGGAALALRMCENGPCSLWRLVTFRCRFCARACVHAGVGRGRMFG